MIRIRNESDLQNWFKKSYKKIGFSKIIRYDEGGFPDFVVLEGNKKVKIELEIKSSNFLLHKHPIKKVDKVICIEKDVNLKIPIIELSNMKLVRPIFKSPYSLSNQFYNLIKKEKVLVTSEVSKNLNLSWNAAESYLKDLVIEGKIDRIKKEGLIYG